jgi:hypothetical protein
MVLVGIGIIGEVVKMFQALAASGTPHRQPPPAAV